jgi:hypothetical protein
MRSASGTERAPAKHSSHGQRRGIKSEAARERGGVMEVGIGSVGDRMGVARTLGTGLPSSLAGLGDVVAPDADDLRARREEPLPTWWISGGSERGGGGDGEANVDFWLHSSAKWAPFSSILPLSQIHGRWECVLSTHFTVVRRPRFRDGGSRFK